MTATAVVADATPFIRLAIRAALERGGVEVVREAGSAADAFEAVVEARPEVLLLDADLDPEMGTAAGIHRACPDLSIVVLCLDATERLGLAAVRAGACGVVSKATDAERLPAIVLGVLDGEAAFPRRLMRTLLGEIRRDAGGRTPAPARGPGLSVRECDVLDLVAEGLRDREIGDRLGISEITVRRHAASAMRKLGARGRVDAVAAYRVA